MQMPTLSVLFVCVSVVVVVYAFACEQSEKAKGGGGNIEKMERNIPRPLIACQKVAPLTCAVPVRTVGSHTPHGVARPTAQDVALRP